MFDSRIAESDPWSQHLPTKQLLRQVDLDECARGVAWFQLKSLRLLGTTNTSRLWIGHILVVIYSVFGGVPIASGLNYNVCMVSALPIRHRRCPIGVPLAESG